MSGFAYRDGALCAEDVALGAIADAVGTPFYCYSHGALVQGYRAIADAFAGMPVGVCYAVKANDNLAVLTTLASCGAGADVVSGGELQRAMAAGIPPGRIVFSGVGKSADEIARALAAGIRQFNVESEPELEAIAAIAARTGQAARVAFRVNPDVDAETHDKIATGRHHDKFGISFARIQAVMARAETLPGVEPVGLAVHIGSQITRLAPYEAAFARLAGLAREMIKAGHAIRSLDLGGGIGIDYSGEVPLRPADYAALVARSFAGIDAEFMVEPGRAVVGQAGVLVATVLYVKETDSRRFLIADAAMNDLIRPSLYDAYHRIVPLREPAADALRTPADVVGPVCETGDIFARDRALPPIAAGERIAILSAGAYGAVMASQYNARPLVPEVLARGGDFAVIRRRPSFAETIALEAVPDWIASQR